MRKEILTALVIALLFSAHAHAGQWKGVDETVIESAARERGMLKETGEEDSGDLMLAAFMLAGATGGFAAGYYYRKLTEGGDRTDAPESRD